MKEKELAKLYYKEVEKIHQSQADDVEVAIELMYYFLHKLFIDITQNERIHFTTLFARIAFTSHKYQIDKNTQYYTYIFRKNALRRGSKKEDLRQKDYLLGLKTVCETIQAIYKETIPEDLQNLLPREDFHYIKPTEIKERIAKLRVIAIEDVPEREMFLAKAEEYPERLLHIRYHDRRNEGFGQSIKAIRNVLGFPLTLNLLDITVDKDDVMTPRAFVVEPDYLVDVTSVAECFKESNSTEPLTYLLSRFLPKESSVPILLGNVANFFLDELTINPQLTFDEVFPKSFKINPFVFAMMSDQEIRDVMATGRVHFTNIKKVVLQQLEAFDIKREECFLEPSFYAETYGLQGRLDLLHISPTELNKASIIELKSGKPFKPNGHGVNHSHYTQTLLYDLMIKSAYGEGTEANNFILYSVVADGNNLRYAPAVKAQQYEAMNQRNQLLAIEEAIMCAQLEETDTLTLNKREKNLANGTIFKRLKAANFQGMGFLERDVTVFEGIYSKLNELESAYFHAFAAMIAREHRLAKTGIQGIENANGVASLWLNTLEEKEDNFQILNGLQISDNQSMEADPIIIFSRTDLTNPLANFRMGDVAVLSAMTTADHKGGVLNNQVFKGTIIDINPEFVVLRLRARQFNQSVFKAFDYWTIEGDMFDSGFLAMYRGLFALFTHQKSKIDLLLTTQAPDKPEATISTTIGNDIMTEEQKQIFKKIISSKDYFLLWGPPGTGKTSVMLRFLAAHLMENTKENVLFLAYTNRAVDEICEAIEANSDAIKAHYIRIGSRYATHPRFHEQLLERQMESIHKRQGLKDLIASKRIFVATVASMNTRTELFKLKTFDTIVIDEASQILEPQLVGLLPKFKRFILIGDHRQLPAVVSQAPEASITNQKVLHDIGLHNLRNSLFERLYHRCRKNNWEWAYDQLSHQGRMHQMIVNFPSHFFYEDKLQILPQGMNTAQLSSLSFALSDDASELERQIALSRKIFCTTPRDFRGKHSKVNSHEATKIVDYIEAFQKLYATNGQHFHQGSLGVITPYRAQIAQILHTMQQRGIDTNLITVDTVERYQGGARDIILISLCTNSAAQVSGMVSLSEDGIDRKLNVALTRARKHLVVLGNEDLLTEVEIYKELIAWLRSSE